MAIQSLKVRSHPLPKGIALLLGVTSLAFAMPATAQQCSQAADLMLTACGFEVKDEEAVGKAKCLQITNNSTRAACDAEVVADVQDHYDLCDEQVAARQDACDAIGDTRYDPNYSPTLFDTNFISPPHPNAYFPLKIGNIWHYATNEGETTLVRVTNRTKRIEGLTCITVTDTVSESGKVLEDTNDWYCQAKNGDVHYVGEETKSYEVFAGDRPPTPELVSIDGSFKSGRDHNKGGIIFPAVPQLGKTYYEEYALGDAEDIAKIVSINYKYGVNASLDVAVPAALGNYFCAASNCVVTQNTSQIEPGVIERKYYAPGIGVFVETNPDTGAVDRLTDCNFDSRCSGIPQP